MAETVSLSPGVDSEEIRQHVRKFAGDGLNEAQIALLLGLSEATIVQHYARDVQIGIALAIAEVGRGLRRLAAGGFFPAIKFFLTNRASDQWRDRSELMLERRTDFGGVPDEQLIAELEAIRARTRAANRAGAMAPEMPKGSYRLVH